MNRKTPYKSDAIIVPESFNIGHGILRLKGLEEEITVEFQGTAYMEMPRFLNGFEISELNESERSDLLVRRPELNPDITNFYKIVSGNDSYCIASLSFRVLDNRTA
ncbi:MAG: hypothetical protein DI539_08315 [Flavobacterium psychrophilum]|nr:MAG: hypothetical protein DI539_08315 [Flavobacterium psychrophilum]